MTRMPYNTQTRPRRCEKKGATCAPCWVTLAILRVQFGRRFAFPGEPGRGRGGRPRRSPVVEAIPSGTDALKDGLPGLVVVANTRRPGLFS